jgi:hypothetical protein
MALRLLVRGCIEPGGEAKPLYSLWGSLAILFAAAAIGDVEVNGIDTMNPCIREAIRVLRSLGYGVEQISSTRLIVRRETVDTKPLLLRMEPGCGLLLVELVAPFFAIHAPPGSRLIVRVHGYEYLLGLDTRPLREIVAQLGARTWGGSRASHYLVVEKMTAPMPRIIRIHSGHWGLIAAIVPALLGTDTPPLLRVTTTPQGARKRVALLSSILSELGYELIMTGNTIRIKQIHEPRNKVAPPKGVPETLLALLYVRLCSADEIVLQSDRLNESDIEELTYLLRIVGYEEDRRGNTLILVKSRPRSLVYSVNERPELSAPLVTHAGIIGDSTISGLDAAIAEGLLSSSLEDFIETLGGEAYIEEDNRLRIVKPVRQLPRQTYSCKGVDPVSCSLIVGTALAKDRSVALNEAEKAIWLAPFLPQQLQELGIDMVVQK